MSFLIILTITVGLFLDATFPGWGQVVTNVWVWSFFIWMVYRAKGAERTSLLVCLVFATLGEILASPIWGLYDYKYGSIPLFVFPGHCMLYTLGVTVSKRLPKQVVWLVPGIALPYILFAVISGFDTESILWFTIFLLCLKFGPAKKLYATMFVLALVMELYGTWLGNWTWRSVVPWLGLSSTNPPACAGAIYCLLDLAVTTVTPWFSGARSLKAEDSHSSSRVS